MNSKLLRAYFKKEKKNKNMKNQLKKMLKQINFKYIN